jgi:hypothetical protein
MPLPTRAIVLALALLLCGNQVAMAQHGISHLGTSTDHACTQCLHQGGQKHALPDSHPTVAANAPCSTESYLAAPSWGGARPHSYQSRAPPALH